MASSSSLRNFWVYPNETICHSKSARRKTFIDSTMSFVITLVSLINIMSISSVSRKSLSSSVLFLIPFAFHVTNFRLNVIIIYTLGKL
jgi:hypothetical protein